MANTTYFCHSKKPPLIPIHSPPLLPLDQLHGSCRTLPKSKAGCIGLTADLEGSGYLHNNIHGVEIINNMVWKMGGLCCDKNIDIGFSHDFAANSQDQKKEVWYVTGLHIRTKCG